MIVELEFTAFSRGGSLRFWWSLSRSHFVRDDKNVVRGNLVPLF